MKKSIRILALLLFVGTMTLTQQGCFGLFSDSEEGIGNASTHKNSAGQSITFSDCSIEMNAKDDNGNERLVYHFTAEVSGMKEQGIQMILSVESPKGTPYTYVDEEGDEIIVKAKKDFKNKNQTNSFSLKNKIVGIQNSQLHLKEGENTYYVRLTAYDENTHAEIGSSPYMAVTMTGTGKDKGKGSSEPTATFSNCKLEQNVMYNDKKMLKFSYDYHIQNAKGHEVQLVMSVECPKGTTHLKTNSDPLENRRDPFIVNTDDYIKKECWAGLYNSTLNPKPGENTYYVCIRAHDLTTGKILGKSDYFSYTQTGSSNSNNNSSKNKSNNNASKNVNSSQNQSSSGPSATFSQCYLEHNVINNNRKMLKCNYIANVKGVKGHDIQFIMTIECPKGTLHYGKDGKTLEAKSKTFTVSYDNSKFDKWQGFYNDNLNPLPGKNTYYVRITAKDLTTGKTLGKSDYLTYTQTGSSNSKNNNNNSRASYSPSTSLHKGYYYIHIAIDPHYCIDLKDGVVNSGQNIQLRRSDGSGGQQWYLEPNNDGSYYIRSRLNNDYVLDAKGGIAADGTNLILYRFNGKANQRWYFEQCSQELYYIHSALDDNYVIDLERANVQNGANIEIYHSKHNNAQRWKINK